MPRRQLSGDRVVIADFNRIVVGCSDCDPCGDGGGLCCPPSDFLPGFEDHFNNPWDPSPYTFFIGNPGGIVHEADTERLQMTATANIARDPLAQDEGTGRSGFIEFRLDELSLSGPASILVTDCRMIISDYENCDPLNQNVVTDLFIRLVHIGDIFDFTIAGQGGAIVHTSGIAGVGTYRLESTVLPGGLRRLRYYINGELIDELELNDGQTQRAWCRGDFSLAFGGSVGQTSNHRAWYDDFSAGLTGP